MNKINSENLTSQKSIENGENTPKDYKKGDIKNESNISEELEDNLVPYPEDDSNSILYNEIDNFCDGLKKDCDDKRKEEPKTHENIEIKEEIKTKESIESTESDSQMNLKINSSQELSLKKNKNTKKNKKINTNIITISLYRQRIQNIIQIKPDVFFQRKKKITKKEFYAILRVNNLDEYKEKIEFVLKEDNSEYKYKTSVETDENILDNDSTETSFRPDFIDLDISEAIMESMTHENHYENSTLVESLAHFNSFCNNSLSTTNDE